MGKASSSKKIQRVQRAGTTKVAGQRRPMGFPLAVLAVIVIGSVLVWLARDSKAGQAAVAPIIGDHWHYAYGFYQCDSYPEALQKLPDGPTDPLGIHTHADGLIHIHPYSSSVTGRNATFGAFATQIGLEVTNSEVVFPAAVGGETWKSGSTCTIKGKKEKAVLKAFVWPPQANDKVKPQVLTSDFTRIRFTKDESVLVVALVPEGTDNIPLPPSMEQLKDPLAAEGGGTPQPTGTVPVTAQPPAEATASTVAPTDETSTDDASTTTVSPSPSTTAAAAPTTTAKKK